MYSKDLVTKYKYVAVGWYLIESQSYDDLLRKNKNVIYYSVFYKSSFNKSSFHKTPFYRSAFHVQSVFH